MKYKVLAVANFVIGLAQLITSFSFAFIVIPKMLDLYSGMNVDVNFRGTYITPIISAIAGIINIYLGYMLLKSGEQKREKYFTISAIYLAFSFIIAAVLAQLSISSVVYPLYQVTSEL